MMSPCKECGNRYVGCHADCSLYMDFRKRLNDQNETIRQEREKDYEWYGKVKDGRTKLLRRRHQKGL